MEQGEVFVQVQSDFFFCFVFKALTSFGHQNLEEFFNLVSNRCFSQSSTRPNSNQAIACTFSKQTELFVLRMKIPKIIGAGGLFYFLLSN